MAPVCGRGLDTQVGMFMFGMELAESERDDMVLRQGQLDNWAEHLDETLDDDIPPGD